MMYDDDDIDRNLNGSVFNPMTGYTEWFLNGVHHREDGPAMVFEDGDVEYWQNGELHRTDGPAIDYNGFKEWYVRGRYIKSSQEYQAITFRTEEEMTFLLLKYGPINCG